MNVIRSTWSEAHRIGIGAVAVVATVALAVMMAVTTASLVSGRPSRSEEILLGAAVGMQFTSGVFLFVALRAMYLRSVGRTDTFDYDVVTDSSTSTNRQAGSV